jgi:hypothetical protein
MRTEIASLVAGHRKFRPYHQDPSSSSTNSLLEVHAPWRSSLKTSERNVPTTWLGFCRGYSTRGSSWKRGGQYRVCDDLEERLRIELESSNSTRSEKYYREEYAKARHAYQGWLRAKEERREEEPRKLSTKMT